MRSRRYLLDYGVRLVLISSVLQAASACGDDSTGVSPEAEHDATLTIVSGDHQSAEVGSPLAEPLIVVLRDGRRAPIARVLVRFADEDGTARDSVLTDAGGSASVRWTLGLKAKTQRISAVATVPRDTAFTLVNVSFTATALAGSAAQIRLTPIADFAPPGSPLDTVTAVVTDRFANGVPYAVIAWVVELGGGSVRALAAKTDVDGVARVLWTLGTGVGENVLAATSGSVAARLTAFASVGFPAASILVGGEHTCALTPAGAPNCWGSNEMGQLGVGWKDGKPHTWPSRVVGNLSFTQLVAGANHTCGLTTDRVAYCWGANYWGQSGVVGELALTPTRVATPQTFAALTAGAYHTCGLTTEGIIYCWGDNTYGQLGDGSDRSIARPFGALTRSEPVPILGGLTFREVAAGSTSTCAVATTGQTYCWGSNQVRELGTVAGKCRMLSDDYYSPGEWDMPCSTKPVAIDSPEPLRSLTASGQGVCGLTSGRDLMCWGVGEIWPMLIPGVRVSAAWSLGNVVCGLEDTEVVSCWGLWNMLRLTTPPYGDGFALVKLSSTGSGSTWCGVSRSQPPIAYCWGNNTNGQLGDGTTIRRFDPVPVGLPGTNR